ncbi:MAG: hypothetical protein KGZ88_14705 [Methylomicrobium sp.]|nr:hypothetical protein [Methylomicrobium sp.]
MQSIVTNPSFTTQAQKHLTITGFTIRAYQYYDPKSNGKIWAGFKHVKQSEEPVELKGELNKKI